MLNISAIVQQKKYNQKEGDSNVNRTYTIELAVAYDQQVKDIYGGDVKNFILSLISITSNMFTKSNIAHSINLSVTNIIYIGDDLNASPIYSYAKILGKNGENLLDKFTSYMKKTNLKYDAGVLLTR